MKGKHEREEDENWKKELKETRPSSLTCFCSGSEDGASLFHSPFARREGIEVNYSLKFLINCGGEKLNRSIFFLSFY